MIERKPTIPYLICAIVLLLMACFVVYEAFALPVRIHKDKSGTIMLQMQPFSMPTSSMTLDAKQAAVIGDSKAKYLIIEYDAVGRVVSYVEAEKYTEAEAVYLKLVKDRRAVTLAPLKVGKTKLEAGKVTDIKAVAVEPIIEP